MKRLLSLILLLCCVLSIASCTVSTRPLFTETQAATETDTEESKNPTEETEDPDVYMLIDGKKVYPEYVLTLDGKKISYDEFRYVYLLEKETLLGTMSVEAAAEYWTEENEKKLLDTVVESLRYDHAMLDYAAKNSITLSPSISAQITLTINQYKNAYGEETFLKQMQSNFISGYDFYRVLLERSYLLNQSVTDVLYGENGERAWDDEKLESYVRETYKCSLDEYYQNTYYRAKHILIQFVEGEDKNNCEKTLQAINAVYEKLQNGAAFDDMIEEYNEDPGVKSSPDGYVFMEGTMVDEFYNGTKALEMNAYSEPVKTDYGFHIILRLPLTDEGKETAKQELLFGNNKIQGAYMKDYPVFAEEVRKAYDPMIAFNPQVEGHINHDSIL